MVRVRLRTKFLVSLLLISIALTAASLLIVRQTIKTQVRSEIFSDLRNSVLTFQRFQQEREAGLGRSAELLSNLPSLKALMTTGHAATIQDASADFWKLGGSDLFVLADRSGKVVALHTSTPGFSLDWAQASLESSLRAGDLRQWWFGGGHLYEVFLKPIYFGPSDANNPLGMLAIGQEIDSRVAHEMSQISSSDVAFWHGSSIVVSTLSKENEAAFAQEVSGQPELDPSDLQLGHERYLVASVQMSPGATGGARLSVLKSYDQGTRFLDGLYRLLLGVGLVAVLCEGLLVFLISHRFTRPLENLVGGVRALEKGDFAYPIKPSGSDEVAEVSAAFNRMRVSLQSTQRQLLESERLATIGRMASSISHDLRHQLTAIVANSEFLSEHKLDGPQREDFYQEIRLAVGQMTELIDSLLEFSRAKEALSITLGSIEDVMRRAIQSIGSHHEFQGVKIALYSEGTPECWFDARKMDRVFFNLLLNACQAAPRDGGKVEVKIHATQKDLEILIADNGPGIASEIRDRLFEPFVSYGKENGTGLGLTIVQKIIEEHGGRAVLESGAPGWTVFKLTIPLSSTGQTHSATQREVTASSFRLPA